MERVWCNRKGMKCIRSAFNRRDCMADLWKVSKEINSTQGVNHGAKLRKLSSYSLYVKRFMKLILAS